MWNHPGSPDPRIWAMKKDLDILYKKFNTLAKGVTFTVKFDANTGSGTMDDLVLPGLAVKPIPASTLVPPDGKSLAGWNTEADGTGTAFGKTADVSAGVLDGPETTLYAVWEDAVYPISYELDGGANDPGNPDKYVHGTGVASFGPAVKEGHVFGGWYADAGFTREVGSIGTDAFGAKTLYAKFTPEE